MYTVKGSQTLNGFLHVRSFQFDSRQPQTIAPPARIEPIVCPKSCTIAQKHCRTIIPDIERIKTAFNVWKSFSVSIPDVERENQKLFGLTMPLENNPNLRNTIAIHHLPSGFIALIDEYYQKILDPPIVLQNGDRIWVTVPEFEVRMVERDQVVIFDSAL